MITGDVYFRPKASEILCGILWVKIFDYRNPVILIINGQFFSDIRDVLVNFFA